MISFNISGPQGTSLNMEVLIYLSDANIRMHTLTLSQEISHNNITILK